MLMMVNLTTYMYRATLQYSESWDTVFSVFENGCFNGSFRTILDYYSTVDVSCCVSQSSYFFTTIPSQNMWRNLLGQQLR